MKLNRFDILFARLLCSLADLSEGNASNPLALSPDTLLKAYEDIWNKKLIDEGLKTTVTELKNKVRGIADTLRQEKGSVCEFFELSAELLNLEAGNYFEVFRRFVPKDPRRAREINGERLAWAWSEFLHGVAKPEPKDSQ